MERTESKRSIPGKHSVKASDRKFEHVLEENAQIYSAGRQKEEYTLDDQNKINVNVNVNVQVSKKKYIYNTVVHHHHHHYQNPNGNQKNEQNFQ